MLLETDRVQTGRRATDVDRTNMSVAVVSMREQFGWDAEDQGLVLGSFFYGCELVIQLKRADVFSSPHT